MTNQIAKFLAARPPIQGDDVFDVHDPRHIGCLVAVRAERGEVRWYATGWFSYVPLGDLKRYEGM